ncbi:hypothetical protein B0I72DRAFT_112601 [Yarrowia lipolytica]|nr:hypothetical protein B0I72DRAFT_112601 [Yarrowia lipolytica]RDW37872.1 hypothetical protein B0I73DRAFT_101705 [Yarrowia lipolytica]RDW44454.1 hypothetical protein B0I74DRAFT_115674 [Yarrowia lipolytica]RDW51422.1 hypothetical protein B0I75DRAFT_106638 [Yarrowia lipolytica]SEI36094.1 YALIA101S10e00496g1_1 [Yarrowia lipolytica]
MTKAARVSPIKKLGQSTAACSTVASAYGKCILENYQTVSKDMCQQEFAKFKDCVQKQMGRKW